MLLNGRKPLFPEANGLLRETFDLSERGTFDLLFLLLEATDLWS